jgi:outer membrane protein assembly factor BamB
MVDCGAESGFLNCPACGKPFRKPQYYCPDCHYYAPEQWVSPEKPRPRPWWKRPLILIGIFSLALVYPIWASRPFIPNPIVLLRWPTSGVGSLSKAGQWSVYARNPDHARYAPAGPGPSGRVRWSVKLGEPTNSAPAVSGGTLYIGGQFRVHAFDASSGNQIWEVRTSGPVHSSPAVAGDLLFLGLLDGSVIALDIGSGSVRWKVKTENYVFGSPVVFGGILYTGSADSSIYALDAQTGKPIWKRRTGGPVLYAPAVKDGILYALSGDRMLYSFSARTGALRLRYRMYWTFLDSPVVANRMVYFVAEDGRLYTIRHGAREYPGQYKMNLAWLQFWLWRLPVPAPPRQTGSVWRFSPEKPELGFVSSPAVTPEALYIGDMRGRFYALNAQEGKSIWECQTDAAIDISPLVVGDRVYFGTKDGNLHALARHRGEPVWRISLGSPLIIGPVYASGLIFVKTEKGDLIAIE